MDENQDKWVAASIVGGGATLLAFAAIFQLGQRIDQGQRQQEQLIRRLDRLADRGTR